MDSKLKNDTNYYPGCHLSSAGKRNPHHICEHLRETLETRRMMENMQKELDRRESRNEMLMVELHKVRNALQETQREMRSAETVSSNALSQHRQLVAELAESKEHAYKLELEIARMKDPCKLKTELQKTRAKVKQLHQDLEQKKLEMSMTEEKISAQIREIETLNRSLDACVYYQGSRKNSVDGSTPSGEKMRAIYYELGKRQSDIRAVSLLLSQAQSDLTAVATDKIELQERVEHLNSIINDLRKSNEKYSEQTRHDGDTIAKLSDENSCADKDIRRLQHEVESLSAQLEESKLSHSKFARDKESEVDVLSEEVLQLQEEKKKMSDTIESLQLSIRQKDSVHALSEQRLLSEVRRLEEDNRHLQNFLHDGENSAQQLEVLRSTLSNALSSNEGLVRESRDTANAHRHAMDMLQQKADRAESNGISLRQDLKALRQEYDVVLMEREEATGALRRALEMAKSLSAKVNEEQDKREQAETRLEEGQRQMQEMLRAKEQMSYAVLDALHKERALNSTVNRKLSEVLRHEIDEDRHKTVVTSRDSLEVSYASGNGGSHESESKSEYHKTKENSSLQHALPISNQPPAGVMEIRNSVLGKDPSSFNHSAGASATNTPIPRPPLPNSSSISSSSSNHLRHTQRELSPMRHTAPGSPEHLDLAHSPSVRNHVIGDLKRLHQEVAALESRDMEIASARRHNDSSLNTSATSISHNSTEDEIQEVHDQLRETHRYTDSPAFARELEEARSGAEESLFRSRSPSSTPPRNKRDLEHSLYDILNMDPRTDFSSSPARRTVYHEN